MSALETFIRRIKPSVFRMIMAAFVEVKVLLSCVCVWVCGCVCLQMSFDFLSTQIEKQTFTHLLLCVMVIELRRDAVAVSE